MKCWAEGADACLISEFRRILVEARKRLLTFSMVLLLFRQVCFAFAHSLCSVFFFNDHSATVRRTTEGDTLISLIEGWGSGK